VENAKTKVKLNTTVISWEYPVMESAFLVLSLSA